MTARAKRILGGLAIAACLVAVATGGAWWLVGTQKGAEWGFERLGALLPGKLDVAEMRGPLRGPLEVRRLIYRTERMEITADRVVIDWRLGELWRRRLDIDRLRADNVHVLVGAPGRTPEARDSLEGPLPDLNLPVAIIVRDGVINQLQVTTPRDSTGLVIDRVTVDARSMRRDSLHVNHLTVRSKPLDLEFSGTALPRGAYPLFLRGAWTYRPQGRPEIHGEGTLAGTLDTLDVVQRLSGPFTANVAMRLFRPLRVARYQGDVEFARLSPRDFDPGLPAGIFEGRVSLFGGPEDLRSEGSVTGTSDALGPTAADFRVQRVDRTWRIDDLVLRRPGLNGRLQARGTVTEDGANSRFALQTEWAGVGFPFRGDPLVESERGTARIEGTARDFGVQLHALLAGRGIPPGTWTLEGRGGQGRLAIRTVIADILDGRIVGAGAVSWKPRVTWRLTFDGRGINPGSVWPQYPGSLAFTGQSEGATGPSGPSGRMLVTRLAGTLRSQPVLGSGTLTARQGQYTLSAASVQWGPNRAEANGGFGRSWSLAWKVDAPRLAAALPEASGSLRSQGTVRGTRGRPHIVGTLAGDSLFVGRAHAGALRADGDLDLAPGGVIRLDAAATKVDAADRSAEHVILAAHGTRDQHELRASVAGRRDSTVAVFAGGFGRDGWRGAVRALDLVSLRAGSWSLAGPAPLTAESRRVEVKNLVWRSRAAAITVNAEWTRGGPWRVDSRLDQVQLSLFEAVLPPRLRLQGPLQGHVLAHATADGRLFADMDLVPGPGEVLHNTAEGQWVPTRFENARLRGTADGRRVQTTLVTDLVNVGTVRAALGWPAYGGLTSPTRQPLDGRVALHLRDIALLQGFTTELDATSGALDADLGISGTVANPYLQGPLSLRNGSADIPRLGLQLREANVQANGSPGGRLALNGSVRSGSGRLAIQGTASVARGAKPIANVTLVGQRVQAMNTRDVKLVASPDLRVALDGNRADVTGEVIIPEGKIDVAEADDRRLVKVSDDVVYSGADTLSAGPIELHSRVRVVLEDHVVVRGFGMEIRPKGSVLATDAPGLPTLGTGELTIEDGTYTIYGQELTIENGSLIFGGGPINNPAIRARASRKAIDGVVAGFDIRGTVMRPDVRVFSEPPMGQSQALSYVLWGKPIEKGNLSEAQMASTMATTLGVPGTNLLAHGLASELGIEQAKIEVGNSFQNTSVSLGTHLSPKVYLSYGMDMYQAASSIRLRYILNRIFTIEAETAHQNRVDLLYTVER